MKREKCKVQSAKWKDRTGTSSVPRTGKRVLRRLPTLHFALCIGHFALFSQRRHEVYGLTQN